MIQHQSALTKLPPRNRDGEVDIRNVPNTGFEANRVEAVRRLGENAPAPRAPQVRAITDRRFTERMAITSRTAVRSRASEPGRKDVKLYDFEVLRGEDIVMAERNVSLHSAKAAWPKLVAIARRNRLSGCRIRVKEQGETIILIGAAAALRYAHFDFASAA